MTATGTPTDWIQVAQSLRPRLEASRRQAECDRRMPTELIRAMAEVGLFRLKLPAKYGGPEVDHPTYFRVVEELSRVDASAGWLVAIANENVSAAGYLPARAADEIFGPDPNLIVAGAIKSHRDDVQVVPGGFRVSGQWTLASGCLEASWLAPAAVIKPSAQDGGRPDVRLFFLPRTDCSILDTWDGLGLRATASHDFVVDGAFVPERRQFAFPGALSGLPGPLWRGDIRTQLGGVGAVALGIGRAAIDELVALADNKVPLFSRSSLRDRPGAQAKVGQAEALLRSARAFLSEVLVSMWTTQCAGDAPSDEQLNLRELATLNAVQASAQAVSLMFDAAGSSAVYSGSMLERCFRDVHVITQHIAGSSNRYEQLGRFFLDQALRR